MLHYLAIAWAWAVAHPLVIWPVLTAIVTTLFKPRTPEEYTALAADWPRLAKVLRLVGAMGLDAPKVLQILGDLAKRPPPSEKPKDPPPGAGNVLLAVLVLGVSLAVAGGTSSCAAFRDDAKTVLDVAKTACIIANQTLPDSKVAEVCDVVGPLLGPMQDVLAASRTATKKALASRVGGPGCADGGVP